MTSSEAKCFMNTEEFLETSCGSIINIARKYPTLRQHVLSEKRHEDLIKLYAHSFLDNLLNPKTPISFVEEFKKHIKYQKEGIVLNPIIPAWWTINNMAKCKVPFLSLLKDISHIKSIKDKYEYSDKNIESIIIFIKDSLAEYQKDNEYARSIPQHNEDINKFNQIMADVLMVNIVWINNKGEKNKYNSKYGTFFAKKFIFLELEEKLLCTLYEEDYCKSFKEDMHIQKPTKVRPDYEKKLKEVLGYLDSLGSQHLPNDKAFINSFLEVVNNIDNVYPKQSINNLKYKLKKEIEEDKKKKEKITKPNASGDISKGCKMEIYNEDEMKEMLKTYFPKTCCLIDSLLSFPGKNFLTT